MNNTPDFPEPYDESAGTSFGGQYYGPAGGEQSPQYYYEPDATGQQGQWPQAQGQQGPWQQGPWQQRPWQQGPSQQGPWQQGPSQQSQWPHTEWQQGYGYPGRTYPGAMEPYPPVSRKEPVFMLLASFFIPGLGTLINGESGKGAAIFGIYVLGLLLTFVLIGIPIVLGTWIWGMVDAYSGAQKFNARHGIY